MGGLAYALLSRPAALLDKALASSPGAQPRYKNCAEHCMACLAEALQCGVALLAGSRLVIVQR